MPLALPTEKTDPKLLLRAPAAGFMVPPRTISDITAILDSERPDPAKISELKAKADLRGRRPACRRRQDGLHLRPPRCSGHPMLLSGTAAGL